MQMRWKVWVILCLVVPTKGSQKTYQKMGRKLGGEEDQQKIISVCSMADFFCVDLKGEFINLS